MITLNGQRITVISIDMRERQKILRHYSSLNVPISSYFMVDDFNYWYLLNYFVFFSHNSLPGCPGLDFITSSIDRVRETKGTVTCGADDPFGETFLACAKLVCEQDKRTLSVTGRPKSRKRENAWALRTMIKARIRARSILGKFRRLLGWREEDEKDVLFLTSVRFMSDSGENTFFGGVGEELAKKNIGSKSLLYAAVPQTGYFLRYFKTFMRTTAPYIGDYYTRATFSKNNKDLKKLQQALVAAKNDEQFKKLFTYQGYNYFDIIAPRLQLVVQALGYIACDARNIAAAIAEREKPAVVCIDQEENLYGKAFMLNARKAGPKVVAMSHELVYPGCMHTHEKNKAVNDRTSTAWRPLPDVKCVPGNYGAKTLTETCNYPASIVKVTGTPKLDRLVHGKMDRAALLKKHGIGKGLKVLVLSTTDHGDMSIYHGLAKEFPTVEWIVKPHPESIEPALASLKKHKNVHLMARHSDIYELLACSDVVLSAYSSAGFEAAVLGLPVIVLNLDKDDMSKKAYVPSEAGIMVTDTDELNAAVRELGDARRRKTVSARMKRYAQELHFSGKNPSATIIAAEIARLSRR